MMSNVIQVSLHKLKWHINRPDALIALVLLLLWLLLDGGHLLVWATTAIIAAPVVLIAASAMTFLPGLAVLRLLWSESLPAIERWPLAIGISYALPPLFLLLSEPLGLHWNTWLCWGYLALSALVVFWPHGERSTNSAAHIWSIDSAHLLLISITVMAVVVRLYVAHDLPVGLWGDSYHHTVIAQLLVDNGGLFSSWQPYAPLATFTYHFGFHSQVAWLSWLSGLPVTRSLLVIGQLQSALAAPLVFLLARRLLQHTPAALWAALLVGVLLPLPAYYVNWGRYTQLAGQTLLPVVCVVWMALLTPTAATSGHYDRIRLGLLAVLVTAGLALTHYRVGIFAACFVLAYTLYVLLSQIRSWRTVIVTGGVGLITGIATLLLIAPWLLRLRTGKWLAIAGHFASTNIGSTQTNSLPTFESLTAWHTPFYLIALALIGSILLIWQRQWRGMVLVGWALLIWLAANPYLIGLTGAGIITNFAVVIAGYLVLAPLAGYVSGLLTTSLMQITRPPLAASGLTIVVALICWWGIHQQQQLAAPATYQLFTPADAAAMDWISQETDPDAQFFVNSFTAYEGTLYAGSDGGWWLPFMTGRMSNLPPLTYGSEAGISPDYARSIFELNAAIQQLPLDTAETAALLRAFGFDYVYDGPAAAPPGEYIDPAALSQSTFYELVYNQDGVTIWRVR